MTGLVIIGAGGHGKVVADVASAIGYDPISFLDAAHPDRRDNGGWPIVGRPDEQGGSPRFCAVGNNAIRARMFDDLALWDAPVLIHPSCVVSPSAQVGAGTVLMAGAIVNADAQIGAGVIVNTAASVDHDCVLGDFTHMSPGVRLAGGVHVGPRTWIGIGAVIREGVSIGADVMVAAGAAVVTDIPDGARVGGVPAKVI